MIWLIMFVDNVYSVGNLPILSSYLEILKCYLLNDFLCQLSVIYVVIFNDTPGA